jgi:hypothetical protein
MPSLREKDMHRPLCTFLTGQGYRVNAEVRGCDLTARKDGELIAIEMKTRFSARLLAQAVRRQRTYDGVYIAIPIEGSKKMPSSMKDITVLCRGLGVGLLLVRYLKTKTRVEVIFHPRMKETPSKGKRRRAVIREIDGRYAELNTAGSTTRDERVTAYKQRALFIASLLDRLGEASPKALRDLGADKTAQNILSMNHYGWFERVTRGAYRLHPAGKKALEQYKERIPVLEEMTERAVYDRDDKEEDML